MNYSFVVASLPYTNSVDSSISAALYGPGLPPRPMRGRRASSFSQTAAGKWARLLHKLLGYLSKVAPKICKSCPKVAHFTKKLLKSCFLSTQKNQFLLLMKVNLCTSIRVI